MIYNRNLMYCKNQIRFGIQNDDGGFHYTQKRRQKLLHIGGPSPHLLLSGLFKVIMILVLIESTSHINVVYGKPSSSSAALASSNFHSILPMDSVALNFNRNHNEQAVEIEAAPQKTAMHRLAKRMDLELCLGQFDIHRNTIIRTGESQALGGKYLQGLELDTLEECQRLCCETETCDVYIFEDKNGGYCYLFECGPPENFHCKFTRHANYTSAVLTTVRHFVEVTTTRPPVHTAPHLITTNLSQQEWELSNLKVKPETTSREKSITAEIPLTANNGMSNNANIQQQQQQQLKQTEISFPLRGANVSMTRCGRFQFTCHSGECIAVYNACDGIPQCEDGSDEGPECSGATVGGTSSSSSSMSGATNSKGTSATSNNIVNGLEASVQKPAVNTVTQYQGNYVQQSTQQQQLQSLQQQQQGQPQTMQNILTTGNINNREDAGAWANRKLVVESEQSGGANNQGELNSRIFNHKGGLQLPTNGNVNGNSNNNNNLNGLQQQNANNIVANSVISSVNGPSNGVMGMTNYPNSNANLGPIYEASNLQHNGIYIPFDNQQQQQLQQQQQQSGGVYAIPQAQIIQGHFLMPSNVNWPQQQQQPQQPHQQILTQQQQEQQHKAVGVAPIINQAADRGTLLQQQISGGYVINAPQQAGAPHLTPNVVAANENPTGDKAVAQLNMQKGNVAVANNQANYGSKKKALASDSDLQGKADNTEYDDEEATEAPKKKQRKQHKKPASIATETPTTHNEKLEAAPHQMSAKHDDDPVQQAIAQRKQNEVHQQQQNSPAVREQYKMIHESLTMEFRDHDGQSDRPGGAVLSLSLGLLITAALAILIGCRMRTVGRRNRRMGGGKTPYSHEADFLVNGMYL